MSENATATPAFVELRCLSYDTQRFAEAMAMYLPGIRKAPEYIEWPFIMLSAAYIVRVTPMQVLRDGDVIEVAHIKMRDDSEWVSEAAFGAVCVAVGKLVRVESLK